MLISNVYRKEEIRNVAIKHLRKHGIKYRLKKRPNYNFPEVDSLLEAKKFNVPIDMLEMVTVTLENGEQLVLPKIVCDMAEFILRDVEAEGLFRKQGSNKRVLDIKLILEHGGTLDSSRTSIDTAVALKRFLRALPEPVIPPSYHELFLRCIVPENKKYLVLLACLLLPSEHINVLAYLMTFLLEVSKHEKMNKMNTYNLAVCLWPCIIPMDDSKTRQNTELVNKLCDLVELMIVNASSIGVIPDYVIEEVGQVEQRRKRRSSSLTRMFSGLRKIVGNGKAAGDVDHHHHQAASRIVTPDLLITPSIDRTRNKKRRMEQGGLSARRKRELVDKLPEATLLNTPFTPSRTPVSATPNPKNKIMASQYSLDDILINKETHKEKKPQWYHRSRSVKNLKEDDDDFKDRRRNSLGPKAMLERRWSQVSQVANFRKKKRSSCLELQTKKSDKNRDEPPAEPDYMRVSKVEYEDIKNRVSEIERRISIELDHVQTQRDVAKNENSSKMDKNIEKVMTAYEQTLVQTESMSPTTDHLARRLSRELRIRRNSENKMIRSPSARKIGNMRRRSRELEKQTLKKVARHQSWHVPSATTIPRAHLSKPKQKTPKQEPMDVEKPVTRSSSFHGKFQTPVSSNNSSKVSYNTSGGSNAQWVSAEGFFSTLKSPVGNASTNSANGRASIAKLRSQNAGMVLAKAKLFDNIVDSDNSTSSTKSQKSVSDSKPTVNKIGATRATEARMSYRVKTIRSDERKTKKSTSPRRRPANVTQRQRIQIAKQQVEEKNKEKPKEDKLFMTPLKETNRNVSSPRCTPRSIPHIKKNLNVRSPKRLCRTPVSVDRKTPLKVLAVHRMEH